ncbi:phosphogluconate dehydratase [Sneathiella chinensis]|uniref:Phosphogluconate dehydratase n=1 Tax=Sneathiella chinensis TaxID=349750 RepID=A0ABQ5U6L8_9PROT|nr:phosphogluconate dehydratase [Sneathiella chinensis]GLQ06131.1 phosphogluconate dehydratase [Sneathiella chinensis]
MVRKSIQDVTRRIAERSRETRLAYLEQIKAAREAGPNRASLSCGNLAHACAASPDAVKAFYPDKGAVNIGIVSAYNDMLSAHQPLKDYPDLIKAAAREEGAFAQFAGGVPAMCDGVTQGQDGMDLSLFSRDVIAMATGVALSHNVFDAVLCLGVCDKIVPGLLIGALAFGHLPVIFVPAGPMPSGLPNDEKARIRQEFARGAIGRDELFAAESASYHSPGTCTFYGTANTNQMLMELMGLHLPGTAFINPGTPLREALTREAARRAVALARDASHPPLGQQLDERAFVNAVVGLLATGGSTNLTLHLLAMAKAAGIHLTWQDFADLSECVPLVTRIYPNGKADVNHFHAAGGFAFLVRTLLDEGYLHEDVSTIAGAGLRRYQQEPFLVGECLEWRDGADTSLDPDILRPASGPFQPTGGLKMLTGNLGRSIIKLSAVKEPHRFVEAPAAVFRDQDEFLSAFEAGKLHRDFVAVLRNQGPKANGMPELHKLTPALGLLQDLGYRVALVTDGRMSGASGKVPAAIHVSPEALSDGNIARIRDGDVITLDGEKGVLQVQVDRETLERRGTENPSPNRSAFGSGRELFAGMRERVSSAETGAVTLFSS